ncbi:MAG: LysR family transcriptional regulator [Granulosicoccus sp.]
MDTLQSLRVLAAVAEHKSFTFASNLLGLSPAMTSKHVQHIEARVGARLLNRNSRNVSLTEAGARYLASVRPLLEGLDEAESQLSEATMAATGTLKVSMPVWMANPSFARIIAAYHTKNPAVVLDLDLSGRKINLVEEGVDLALRVARSLDEGLIARKLAQVEFLLVGSPGFLNRQGRPDSVDDLIDAPFLIYSQIAAGGRFRFGEGDDAMDFKVSPVLQSGNETLIHLGAREGMGFAFLPHWLVTDDFHNGVLEPVLPGSPWPKVPLYAIYPDRSYLPAKVRSFLDFLAGPDGMGATSIDT